MNTHLLCFNSWRGIALLLFAQLAAAADVPPVVTERGPNHRVVQKVRQSKGSDGKMFFRTNRVTELATGLHYAEDGVWKETSRELEIFENTLVARHGPLAVIFQDSINTENAIDISMRDGKRIRMHPVAISLCNPASGEVVFIGQVRDSVAEVVGEGRVLYRDAFENLTADIEYIYSRRGLEQNVWIRKQLPFTPADFNFGPDARLEVTSAFVELPAGRKVERKIGAMTDESLELGSMRIGKGRAFSAPAEKGSGWSAPVLKSWLKLAGRDYLVESLEYQAIEGPLSALPIQDAEVRARLPKASELVVAKGDLKNRTMPALKRTAQIGRPKGPIQVAASLQQGGGQPGVIIDWSLVSSGDEWIFLENETYWVRDWILLDYAVFNGLSVIKFAPEFAIELSDGAPCIFNTSIYKPVIFTSESDSTIGAAVTNLPLQGFYGEPALLLRDRDYTISNVVIRYAAEGIRVRDGGAILENCQFVHGLMGVRAYSPYYTVKLRNVLMDDVIWPVYGTNVTIVAEHLTVNKADKLTAGGASSNTNVFLTNSIFVRMTNSWGTATVSKTNSVGISSESSALLTVGGGSSYLPPGSSWRNSGTTNVSASVLASIRGRTVSAPEILTNKIDVDTILSPRGILDIDTPARGFHYAPVDFAVSVVEVTNCTLLITNGAVLTMFGNSGLVLRNNSGLISQGVPHRLNRFIDPAYVQEQPTNWWASAGTLINPAAPVTPPTVRLRFTSSILSSSGSTLLAADNDGSRLSGLELKDSEFVGGMFSIMTANTAVVGITNCLWDWMTFYVMDDPTLTVRNCLFRNTLEGFFWQDVGTNPWKFHDNALDSCPSFYNVAPSMSLSNNAYFNSSDFYSFYGTNQSELVRPAAFGFLEGPLGRYYLPTNSALVNAGSLSSAALGGFYSYTTSTNQVQEGTNRLDIGLHYVATTNGVPIDTDGDGLWDVLEDVDGDGVVDSGETDWTNALDPGLRVFITRPRNGWVIP